MALLAAGAPAPVRAAAAEAAYDARRHLENVPPQPGDERWQFVNDLRAPMWSRHPWTRRSPAPGLADLSAGVRVVPGFPDPLRRLETAHEDLREFLAAGGVAFGEGPYTIETTLAPELAPESFRLEIGPRSGRVLAADPEGIRRGIFHLEDEMLRQRGAFLPLGTIERTPFIQRRISRCFFGPIKRPPRMRDELMDDVDYYPDAYLNRLAHEGINGLWLTVEFRDLVATRWTPEAGKDAARRLAKLQRTVEKCLRHGIRTYLFCIEPREWEPDSPVVQRHPELAGAPRGQNRLFCPQSDVAQAYLYEAVNQIFRAVPGLGGMINITHGERPTTCLSAVACVADHKGVIRCPRCGDKQPWEILHASLSAMERGMHNAAPDAELISWLYMPTVRPAAGDAHHGLAAWVFEIPAHTPRGVILQCNFESGVARTEFGKELVGGDYWIATPGPSARFERVAQIARLAGTPVSAKIQTANSHEVATVPNVPVPSLLYRKFAAMRRLGVTHTMLCWYFGNYPGLMNKATLELSREPFPEDEDAFLRRLAATDWQPDDVPKVVEAWRAFAEGFESYPLTNAFQYYGPMHDGPVWPLLLKPVDAPLSPTWLLASTTTRQPWPPSGDRIGECLGEQLTLAEAVELARRMTTAWDRGVNLLAGLETRYAAEPERLLDIGVARALGIQFRSGYNILRFYQQREAMLRTAGRARLEQLQELQAIVREELELDARLLVLCERDSRLGFHSEAEGYKYYPEKIRWRMAQLRRVLAEDFPEVERVIRSDQWLFPEYTGAKPAGAVAPAVRQTESPVSRPGAAESAALAWQPFTTGAEAAALSWAASYDANGLQITVRHAGGAGPAADMPPLTGLQVRIEPRRLHPARSFSFTPATATTAGNLRVEREAGGWRAVARVSFAQLGLDTGHLQPIRVDLRVQTKSGTTNTWRPNRPTTYRLAFGTENSADLGWLVFR